MVERDIDAVRAAITEIDVSPLVPEAREIVTKAANVYIRHTTSWLIGLLVHGSALKGGFIPGCSDIDFQLFLDDGAFECDGLLPVQLAAAIHRDLSAIDPSPFAYIQCYPMGRDREVEIRRGGGAGPIPGAYHLLAGELPVPEASAQQLREHARIRFELSPLIQREYPNNLLQHGAGHLEREVRYICTDVWPVLYCFLTLRCEDPLEVWCLPKDAAMALLPRAESPGREIQIFYHSILAYYGGNRSMELALRVIGQGVAFIHAAGEHV